MKKQIVRIGLAVIASVLTTTAVRAEVLTPQVVTNQSAVIVKSVTPDQLAAIIAGVQSLGVSSTVPITMNNLASCSVVARNGVFACYIAIKPVANVSTNTSTNGVQLVTRTAINVRVPVLNLTATQLGQIETLALGEVGDLGISVAPSNTASIYLGPQTNSANWQVTLRLK